MSSIRRVVTGHDQNGRSVIASDATAHGVRTHDLPGVELTPLWSSDDLMTYPDDGSPRPAGAFFAPPGGFRFAEFVIDPDDAPVRVGQGSALTEFPGLLENFDPDVPGMHRSATVDLLYVIEGRVMLELDDGSRTELRAGDCVVQSGTMHAWRNPFERPCRVLATIVGAEWQGA